MAAVHFSLGNCCQLLFLRKPTVDLLCYFYHKFSVGSFVNGILIQQSICKMFHPKLCADSVVTVLSIDFISAFSSIFNTIIAIASIIYFPCRHFATFLTVNYGIVNPVKSSLLSLRLSQRRSLYWNIFCYHNLISFLPGRYLNQPGLFIILFVFLLHCQS